ncbi:hypothetical protein F4823DRAFT_107384 [Ustulina deusta]|nr:hypothetical protein F4823DRAFT_107384 [Ustulina deusta]
MYISKFLCSAVLVLSGFALANPTSGEDASVVGRDAPNLDVSKDAGNVAEPPQDPNASPYYPDRWRDRHWRDRHWRHRHRDRGWCRYGEYWDDWSRRCRHYEPLPRPWCYGDEMAFCGRDGGDIVRYDRSDPHCWRRSGYRTFCFRRDRYHY